MDYYDAEGVIDKDKCVSAETVEAVMGAPLSELIEDGRKRENDLTARIRQMRSTKDFQHD